MIAKLCPAKIRHRSSLSSLLFLGLLLKSLDSWLNSLLSLLFNSLVYGPTYKSSTSLLRPPSKSSAKSSSELVRPSPASLCRPPFYERPFANSLASSSIASSSSYKGPLSIKKLSKNHLPKDAVKWPNLILLLFIFNFGQLDASRFSNLSASLSPNSSSNLSHSSLDSSLRSSPDSFSNLSSPFHSTNSTKNTAILASSFLTSLLSLSFFSQSSNVSQISSFFFCLQPFRVLTGARLLPISHRSAHTLYPTFETHYKELKAMIHRP